MVSIWERPLQCGVTDIEIPDVYPWRSTRFDRLYAKNRPTGFFPKMHFNGSESLKGNGHPQRVPYPWGFVCSGALEEESRFISKL